MASKAELALHIEAFLEKGGFEYQIDPTDYKKGQLDAMVKAITEGKEAPEIKDMLVKELPQAPEDGEGAKAPGRAA
ncbi:MAG: hypothetical protein LC687_01385, partial [Actinobacteria bacterium]|nr:hypothetical protein [Actinomycetota bacterium]